MADGEHDVGRDTHADVQQKVNQAVFGEFPVDEGKQEVQNQGGGAEDGNDRINGNAAPAKEPVAEPDQQGSAHQNLEQQFGSVVAAQHQRPQKQQCGRHKGHYHQAPVQVRVFLQKEVYGSANHHRCQQQKGRNFKEQRGTAARRGCRGKIRGVRLIGAGQRALAQGAVRAAAHLDVAMGAGFHRLCTSLAYRVMDSPASARLR